MGIITGILTLYGLGMVGWLAWEAISRTFQSTASRGKVVAASPFIELVVPLVSEGDEVSFAYMQDGRYTAHIENKRKKAKLDIEADSQEELTQKVADTFRAWAITGKKKPGR